VKIDLHVHTKYSQDASGEPKEIAKALKNKGFEGMAVTDHNTIDGVKFSMKDFVVVSGMEISTSEGHLIGLGIDEPIERGFPLEDTIEMIHDLGGIAIVPHPYRIINGIGGKLTRKISANIEAIETFNGRSSFYSNSRSQRLADALRSGKVGGSDSHSIEEVGIGYTIVHNSETAGEIIDQIKKRETIGGGKNVFSINRSLKSLLSFAKRGFRRI
jgi:hypothetical protein